MKKLTVLLYKIVFFMLLFAGGQQALGQTENWSAFIPKDFTLLDSASGDLNRDAYKDMVLIIKSKDEDMNSDAARPLLLLAGTAKGAYQLLSRNDSVVLCKNCGGVFGDPYQAIAIKNGYFSIEHYGGSNWRWTRIITFKYDAKSGRFILHRDAGVSFHTANPNKKEDIITNKEDYGKLLFTQYSYNKGF